ncbi:MAG: hypothetical protein ACYCX4_11075 [Bacillota bacterium]
MPTYDKLHSYTQEKAFSLVKIGAKSPVLDVEFNEMQAIMAETRAAIVRQMVPSGIPETLSALTYGSSSLLNAIKMAKQAAIVNGYQVIMDMANGEATGQNKITLSDPPASGIQDALVFYEAWSQEVAVGQPVYKNGGVNSGVVSADDEIDASGNLKADTRIGAETARRIQLRWRIRVVDNVDFATYPEGLNHTVVVKAQGGALAPDNNYTFALQSSDPGLYRSGDGSTGAKTALNTVDGYVYAIPLFRVKRRNNTAYSASNPRGGQSYYNLGSVVFGSTVEPLKNGQCTVGNNYNTLQVGDIFEHNSTPTTYKFKVVSKDGGSTITVTNLGTSSLAGGYTNTLGIKSVRPDGLYSNIIDARDIIDLRHKVSLTGFNFNQILDENFDKLLRGDLLTKDTKQMLKIYHGVSGLTSDANTLLMCRFDGSPDGVAGVDGGTSVTAVKVGAGSPTYKPGVAGQAIDCASNFAYDYSITVNSTTGTIEFFIEPDSRTSIQGLFSLAINGNAAVYAEMMADGTDRIRFNFYNNDGTVGKTMYAVAKTGLRTKIKLTWDNGIITLKANDTQVDQQSFTLRTGVINSVRIFGVLSGTYFDGRVDEFRVSDIVRTIETQVPADVAAGYAQIMPAFNGQRRIYSDALTGQYTVGFARGAGSGHSVGITATQSISGQWNAGVKQIETATVVGTITTAGNATVIVTATGMTGSPKTLSVAVALNDDASTVASKIRTDLSGDVNVGAFFDVSGTGADVILTAKAVAANDATMNISIDNGTCAGLTPAPTSANTRAGNTTSDTIKAKSLGREVISGVIDADTALTKIMAYVSGAGTNTFVIDVEDVSKLIVGDTFRVFANGVVTGSVWTVSSITGNRVTCSLDVASGWGSEYTGGLIYETTASSSIPVVKFSNSGTPTTVNGTWANLGTNEATFTLQATTGLTNQDIQVEYSLNMPAGQGGIPEVYTETLQGEVKGKKLVNGTVAIRDDFVGKVEGSTVVNPNVCKWDGNTSLLAPSSFTSEINVLGPYSNIATLNGTTVLNQQISNGVKAQVLFSFDIIRIIEDKFGPIPAINKRAWIIANLSSINCNFWGYGSSPTTNQIAFAVYNFTTSTYNNMISGAYGSPTKMSYTLGISTDIFDASSKLHLLVYTTEPSNGSTPSRVYTDYINIELIFTGKTGYDMLVPDNPRRDDGLAGVLLVRKETKEIESYLYHLTNADGVATWGNYIPYQGNLVPISTTVGTIVEVAQKGLVTTWGTGSAKPTNDFWNQYRPIASLLLRPDAAFKSYQLTLQELETLTTNERFLYKFTPKATNANQASKRTLPVPGMTLSTNSNGAAYHNYGNGEIDMISLETFPTPTAHFATYPALIRANDGSLLLALISTSHAAKNSVYGSGMLVDTFKLSGRPLIKG